MLHNSRPPQPQSAGFSFENTRRNAVLEGNLSELGYSSPKARKTGTTIAGIVFKDGVILGADTRATDDMVVADKNCMKIHYIAPNIYCCGAGVAADAEVTTQMMSSNVELHSLSTGRPPLVVMVTRQLKQMLFRYQGHIGSSLIVGGVDVTGAHLYSVYPHGSYDKLPFLTMGSGAGAAISIFEDRYQNMHAIVQHSHYDNSTPESVEYACIIVLTPACPELLPRATTELPRVTKLLCYITRV
uniref:Proteasome subunit beta n=1 Tax=Salmo salar TaxID=8030 RepID=B5XCM9_SALSA|nr:Proteasome subunit beta type-7 precursor [Salmo salar]